MRNEITSEDIQKYLFTFLILRSYYQWRTKVLNRAGKFR